MSLKLTLWPGGPVISAPPFPAPGGQEPPKAPAPPKPQQPQPQPQPQPQDPKNDPPPQTRPPKPTPDPQQQPSDRPSSKPAASPAAPTKNPAAQTPVCGPPDANWTLSGFCSSSSIASSTRDSPAAATEPLNPTNAAKQSHSDSSSTPLILAGVLGTVLGVTVFLLLGFFAYRWWNRRQQHKDDDTVQLNGNNEFPMVVTSQAEKAYPASTTTRSSSDNVSSYRGMETAETTFKAYNPPLFEMDAAGRAPGFYRMPPPRKQMPSQPPRNIKRKTIAGRPSPNVTGRPPPSDIRYELAG